MSFTKRNTTASSISGLQDRIIPRPAETIQEISLFEYNQMEGNNKIDIPSLQKKNL